ncbi:MAG: LCP family protein [Patescibacteria group bacterium]
MAYYSAGSREDEIMNQKLANFGKVQKYADKREDPEKEKQRDDEFPRASRASAARGNPFKTRGAKLKKTALIFAVIVVLAGAGVFYKTSSLFSKISTSGGSIFGGLFKNKDDLEGMSEGRINVILLGMRGQNIPGGSLLADSIMVVSVKPGENKVAMISIPRDLYVEIPGKNYSRKINEVNPIGEEEGKGKGLELMKEVVGNVTGLPIHYAISANFDALRDTVDVIGGITVHLDKPFYEGKQFVEGNECGGEFSLPEGEVDLSGEKALCYSRARFATSDFDRARRQQEVLLAIKEKALSAGTLSDFGKVNDLLNVMGDNIRTDMKPWEMQKLFEVTNEVDDPKVYRKVFDTSEQGLLKAANNGSYILLPADEDFGRIKEECKNIFNDSNTAKK